MTWDLSQQQRFDLIAKALGSRKFGKILSLYSTMSICDLADKYLISPMAVYLIYDMSLEADTHMSHWTSKQDKLLENSYPYYTSALEHSREEGLQRALQLKLISTGWDVQNLKYLTHYRNSNYSIKTCAAFLHKNVSDVQAKAKELGLLKRYTPTKIQLSNLKKLIDAQPHSLNIYDLSSLTQIPPETISAVCFNKKWTNKLERTNSKGCAQLKHILQNIYPNTTIIEEYQVGEKLRLDLNVPDLNIGFEYDGIQHFEFTPMFHNCVEDFLEGVRKDTLKEKLCTKRGITLVRFSYKEVLTKGTVTNKIKDIGYGTGIIEDASVLTAKEKKAQEQNNYKHSQKQKQKEWRKKQYEKLREFKKKKRGVDVSSSS